MDGIIAVADHNWIAIGVQADDKTMLAVYYPIQETAKRWGISVRWVNQYALDGRIPSAERLGRFWTIPEDAVKPEKRGFGPKPKETSERGNRRDDANPPDQGECLI